jgi:DNA mismatch repair ATPase MutL
MSNNFQATGKTRNPGVSEDTWAELQSKLRKERAVFKTAVNKRSGVAKALANLIQAMSNRTTVVNEHMHKETHKKLDQANETLTKIDSKVDQLPTKGEAKQLMKEAVREVIEEKAAEASVFKVTRPKQTEEEKAAAAKAKAATAEAKQKKEDEKKAREEARKKAAEEAKQKKEAKQKAAEEAKQKKEQEKKAAEEAKQKKEQEKKAAEEAKQKAAADKAAKKWEAEAPKREAQETERMAAEEKLSRQVELERLDLETRHKVVAAQKEATRVRYREQFNRFKSLLGSKEGLYQEFCRAPTLENKAKIDALPQEVSKARAQLKKFQEELQTLKVETYTLECELSDMEAGAKTGSVTLEEEAEEDNDEHCSTRTKVEDLRSSYEPGHCFDEVVAAVKARDELPSWAEPLPDVADLVDFLESQSVDDLIPDFAEFTLEQLLDYGDEATITMGKYAGQTFVQVATSDPDYCKWLLTVKNCLNVRYFNRWYASFVTGSVTMEVEAEAEETGSVKLEVEEEAEETGSVTKEVQEEETKENEAK